MLKKNLSFFLLFFIANFCFAQQFLIDTSLSVNKLISEKFIESSHEGLHIKNIVFKGEPMAIGSYIFESLYQDLPYTGIILGTGNVIEAGGPNEGGNASTKLHRPGDADLESIMLDTQDATVVEFDFMSLSDSVAFSFVFASEEYPEYVKKGVSDVFGFFVNEHGERNRTNIAYLPNSKTPISIDLINQGINSHLFTLNKKWNGGAFNGNTRDAENAYLLQFDGFTKEIFTGLRLKPYHMYHFKIAIADVGDMKFDSWVLLRGKSFASVGKVINPTEDDIERFYGEFTGTKPEKMTINGDSISMMTEIHFAFNSAEVGRESLSAIEKIKSILKYSHYNVIVKGYADERGNENYNLELSKRRADAVKHKLMRLGVAQEKIETKGCGELSGIDNHKEARKVEFVFY